MKKISQEQGLTLEEIKSILCEVKKGDITRVTFKNEQLRRFFPRNYTNDQIKQAILDLLQNRSKQGKQELSQQKQELSQQKQEIRRKCRRLTENKRKWPGIRPPRGTRSFLFVNTQVRIGPRRGNPGNLYWNRCSGFDHSLWLAHPAAGGGNIDNAGAFPEIQHKQL